MSQPLAALRQDSDRDRPTSDVSRAEIDGFGEFLAQIGNLLAGLANAHLYPNHPLAGRFGTVDMTGQDGAPGELISRSCRHRSKAGER